MKGPYDDILGLPRHVSAKHPPMPRRNRAAQFAPFSALAGYGDAIRETARHTEPRRELDPQRQQELDAQLRRLLALGSGEPQGGGGLFSTGCEKGRGRLPDGYGPAPGSAGGSGAAGFGGRDDHPVGAGDGTSRGIPRPLRA